MRAPVAIAFILVEKESGRKGGYVFILGFASVMTG